MRQPLGLHAGLLEGRVDARAVTELEEIFDQAQLRRERAFRGNGVGRERKRFPPVDHAGLRARGTHQRNPTGLQTLRQNVGVAPASRLSQATLARARHAPPLHR